MQPGRVLTHPALARRRFQEIAGRPDPLLDLVEGSLVIALEENPAVDVDRHLENVRTWEESVRERLGGSRDVERIVETINRVLFDWARQSKMEIPDELRRKVAAWNTDAS